MEKKEQRIEKYSPKTVADAMRKIETDWEDDPEIMHQRADKLLIDILESLGYKQVVKIFDGMKKWYA